MANDSFLVDSSRPSVEASIEMAEQLAPSAGSSRGVVAVADRRRPSRLPAIEQRLSVVLKAAEQALEAQPHHSAQRVF